LIQRHYRNVVEVESSARVVQDANNIGLTGVSAEVEDDKMKGELAEQVFGMIEDRLASPTPMEFEMAYQARFGSVPYDPVVGSRSSGSPQDGRVAPGLA
jgi:hypothetical protein